MRSSPIQPLARPARSPQRLGYRPGMERAADPYRDTTVIDARAPRFNQAVVGLGSLAAVTVGP